MENKNSNEKDYSKKIIILIILIVALLSLITSCSCTSNFLGELGSSLSDSISNLFKKEDDIDIDGDYNNEVITNQELKFDNDDIVVDLDYENVKLTFTYSNIKPKSFTCSTSDASIATCYVVDGYVVVTPKKSGKVKVSLQTTVNGKIYEATTNIEVKDVEKSLNLASNGGVIDLKNTNKKYISYTLIGIEGDVTAKSSNNAVATAAIEGNRLVITAHKTGTASITVSLKYNGKEYKDSYTVTVINTKQTQNTVTKPANGDSNADNKDPNTGNNPNEGDNKPGEGNDNPSLSDNDNYYLSSITIANSKYKLDRDFDKNINTYTLTTDYNEKNLSISTTLESKDSTVSYKLNGKTISILSASSVILNLTEGDNKLEIIVKSRSGKTNTYTINIRRPIRIINFEEALYNLYTKQTYNINYIIEEDGKIVDDYNLDDIMVTLDNYVQKDIVTLNKGYITVKITDEMAFKTMELKLSYNNKNASTNLKILKYYLNAYQTKYDIGFNNYYGEKDFVLNTNLFSNERLYVEKTNNNKNITVSSKDKKMVIELAVNGDNIKLEYIGNEEAKSSLPFKIVALSLGKSFIHVIGKVNDEIIDEFDIVVNVIEKYIVKLLANGGVFNELTDEYELLVGYDEEIDLSEYDEPYKMSDNTCSIYKFKGYSRSSNGDIEFDLETNKIIKNLNGNLTLYAIYDTTTTPVTNQSKTLWLNDTSLFFNEEYYKKYGKEKVIYPGAKGVYIMNFTNKTSSNITLTGLILKENNICIENKDCLNMGYIIKHSKPEEDNWTYYYGDKNDNYWILNSHSNTIKESENQFKSIIDFNDKKIEMKPNEVVVISLFWKWVEVNDELDTLIGNHAAKKLVDNSINDMYGVSIGLNYETDLKCN